MIPDHIKKDFYCEVDGFYVYSPSKPGGHTAYQLRQIADELDKMNAHWEWEVADYFDNDRNL